MPGLETPDVLASSIGSLEKAVKRLAIKVGAPLYLAENERARFRHASRSPEVLRVVKAVRVVSGLYACCTLLQQNFIVESGVLFRTIDDFLEEIDFMRVDVGADLTSQQERFLEHFFFQDMPTQQELQSGERRGPPEVPQREIRAYLARRRRIASVVDRMLPSRRGNDQEVQPRRVRRQKIRAHVARVLEKFASSFDRVRRISKSIDDQWSGFVHGSYPSSMELYLAERFHLRGLDYQPKVDTYWWQVAIYVQRSCNAIGEVALELGLIDLADELVAERKTVEASDWYPS